MSFESITDITSLVAVYEDCRYHISSLDIRMSLGGSVRASFVVVGEADNSDKLTDLSEFTADDGSSVESLVSFKKGSWVTLELSYLDADGEEETVELYSGRIRSMNDRVQLSATGIAMGRGYTLVSDLDFVDKMPLGSLFVPSIAMDKTFTPAVFIGKNYWDSAVGKLTNGCSGKDMNIAKLAADLIDMNTLDGSSGITADSAKPSAKISNRVNLDESPILDGVLVSETLGASIAQHVSSRYASSPPLKIFTELLSKFFLICAPRTTGKTDVVENNGWKKTDKSDYSADIGYDLITGLSMVDATSGSPGFDGVAVDIMSYKNPGQAQPGKYDTQYVVCTEVFDEDTGRPRLLTGQLPCHQDKEGIHFTSKSGERFAVGKLKIVQLADWMKFVSLTKVKKGSGQDAYASRASIIKWAEWMTFGAYAELNRIGNRASLDLRFQGYLDFADRLGEILTFNVPGNAEPYYGRLAEIGIQLSMTATQFGGKAFAVLDCVRDSEDNKNLCIDFTMYKDR